jgi:hypothetical protein
VLRALALVLLRNLALLAPTLAHLEATTRLLERLVQVADTHEQGSWLCGRLHPYSLHPLMTSPLIGLARCLVMVTNTKHLSLVSCCFSPIFSFSMIYTQPGAGRAS